LDKENIYFTIEPYVYISIKKRGVFLYNTLNQNIIESDNPLIINLIKKLKWGNHLQVVKLNWEQVKKEREVFQFLKQARNYFMGDIIHGSGGATKPVQLIPMSGLQEDEDEKNRHFSFTKRGKIYLREITLFINASCDIDCSICHNAYKQFICCHQSRAIPQELKLENIKKILEETDTGFLTRINISGGNILTYNKCTELIDLLKKSKPTKALYIHYLNLAESAAGFNIPVHQSFLLNILVTFPVNQEKLKNLLFRLESKNLNFKAGFIAQSEKELIQAQDIIRRFRIDQFSLSPYYNGKNITFFKKYVYVKKKNMLHSKPSIKDILARKVVNHNYFGHLVIQNNGGVYASINDNKALGNISSDSIGQLVCKELQKKNRWLKTRDRVKPCRDCHYQLLCPSISNYEYAMGKNNLCNIE
jgi:pseudo-rSAM protein